MDGQLPIEAREVSGLTTSLTISYVEKQGGPSAVRELLARAGMEGEEEALRDENSWFCDERRVALFDAAADVLNDPEAARHIGSTAIASNVGQALKIALRGLGSPRLIYSNVSRASAKFNTSWEMTLLDVSDDRATIRSVPKRGQDCHRCDCDYTIGLLACVPEMFGLPAATIRHPICIGRGADECVFEAHWTGTREPLRQVLLGLGILGATAALVPAALPYAGAAAAALAFAAARRLWILNRGRLRRDRGLGDHDAEVAGRMMATLKELTSELHLDDVLAAVTANAQAAVGGAEFVLLVSEDDRWRCRSSSGLPPSQIELIEHWADRNAHELEKPLVLEDVQGSELSALAEDPARGLHALCAAPLVSRGRPLGALIALATGSKGFLPHDSEQLQAYAAQAAIALSNARLYQAQQELAIQDPLTGLYNHRHFHDMLEREVERSRRGGDRLGLVLLDLNEFKQVNDREGHGEGDEVLRAAATALRNCARRYDIAFRIGGDEFAMVLPQSGSVDVERVARRAARAITRADHRARVSWGVAAWPADGQTKDTLIEKADLAMYAMKRRHRPRDSFAAPPRGVGARAPTEVKQGCLASNGRLTLSLAPMLNAGEMAEATVRELVSSFSFGVAAVMRADGRQLRMVAAEGDDVTADPGLREYQQPIAAGICGRSLASGEQVVVNDSVADPDFIAGSARDKPGSELVTPIRVDGEIWGVLNLEHRGRDAFGFEETLFAETVAATLGTSIHRARLHSELEGALLRTLSVLDTALEAKDSYTAAHSRGVAVLAEQVAERMGLSEEETRNVSYGAQLHDIGKIGIRSETLLKPSKLTPEEYEEIKQHTVIGARMLQRIPFFGAVHPLIRSSHERWDGAGYPDGLARDEIPIGSRIISACDAYDAMRSDRPYRSAMPEIEARVELTKNVGTQFDPDVTRVLLELLDDIASGTASAEVAHQQDPELSPSGPESEVVPASGVAELPGS